MPRSMVRPARRAGMCALLRAAPDTGGVDMSPSGLTGKVRCERAGGAPPAGVPADTQGPLASRSVTKHPSPLPAPRPSGPATEKASASRGHSLQRLRGRELRGHPAAGWGSSFQDAGPRLPNPKRLRVAPGSLCGQRQTLHELRARGRSQPAAPSPTPWSPARQPASRADTLYFCYSCVTV